MVTVELDGEELACALALARSAIYPAQSTANYVLGIGSDALRPSRYKVALSAGQHEQIEAVLRGHEQGPQQVAVWRGVGPMVATEDDQEGT